jgi:predicted dehydrogenase
MGQKNRVHRRDFMKAAAAGATVMSLSAATYRNVLGANDRIGIAFWGVGGRCQQHIDVILKMQQDGQAVRPVGVCDVWDGDPKLGSGKGRGLYPSAKRCGLDPDDRKRVTKDYRVLLELPEVDVVCIATPDHWHAKMAIDAANAKKHIYLEKPMTKTIDEAHAVLDAARKNNIVMTIGVQWMADPLLPKVNEMIRKGEIGHVAQAQTSYYRNSLVGQWRYYPLTKEMTPQTIDWDMFLGHQFSVFPGVPLAPKMPFDRAKWAQWRCYWEFGGGMFTDLFVHRTTRIIAAMGVRYPARVVGGGGIYLEYDGRDVPDVATIVADYDEGCQLIITATMINDHPIEECIRGRTATLRFTTRQEPGGRREYGVERIPQTAANKPTRPGEKPATKPEFIGGGIGEGEATEPLWANFLECCRANKRETMSPPELGAAAFTTVAMGVQSYREGKVLFWDKSERKVKEADASWAARWEKRSKERGKPNQIIGWEGGDRGSTLEPPEYQKLEGPWIGGKDPAAGTGG